MAIKDLQAGQGNVNIVLTVDEVGNQREFQKFGKPGRVATAKAHDDNQDNIQITLWNDEIDAIKNGDKVQITNGYVKEWQGNLQITSGKMGKIEVIGSSEPQGTQPVYRNYPPEEDEKMLQQQSLDQPKEEFVG